MKKVIIFLLGIIFLFSIFYFLFSVRKTTFLRRGEQNLKIGQTILKVEIADTPEKRNHGLSDRKSLCDDCGLLFIFDAPGVYPFWMRRMYFDIDILWIRDREVADITYDAKAPPKFSLTLPMCKAERGCLNEEWESPKTFYQSKVLIDMVLEVNSGWVKEKGIKVGNKAVKLF